MMEGLFKKNKKFVLPETVRTALSMNCVSSMERYAKDEDGDTPVLQSVSLEVPARSIFGVTGEDRFALQLIAEIAGTLKPHEKGRCILMETGMMRKKRRILPHVFYVNDQDVLYDHMQVLTYLMFISEHAGDKHEVIQERWLELLLDTGSYRMALTRIAHLTRDERMLVSLHAACASKARIVMADLSMTGIPRERHAEFTRLFARMSKEGKTVFLVCPDEGFVGRCCTHAALLADGCILVSGEIKALCEKYDRRLVTIFSVEARKAADLIAEAFPELGIVQGPGKLKLYGSGNPLIIMEHLAARGIRTEGMITGEKTLEEALLEARRT